MSNACIFPGALYSKRLIAAALFLCSVAWMPAPSLAAPLVSDGYSFTNFGFPGSGDLLGTGTNVNGIANSGVTVGFSMGNDGNFANFVRNPDGTTSSLNLNPTAMAFGVNSAGDVVGTQNGAAFLLQQGGTPQTLTNLPNATSAFGINDKGNIVGQYAAGATMPGFFVNSSAGNGLLTINAPSGPDIVNAQGINNNGSVVGFYLGTDGQDHGFTANTASATNGILTGSAIADPILPNVAGEPGATFVFSQILGVNDQGIAVGYYGDSTTSQHGFLLNLKTDAYTFLDDPSEQFDNGVEVTQITGINDSGEIAGFYSDAGGVFHGFTACSTGSSCSAVGVPEPGALLLDCAGLAAIGFVFFVRRSRTSPTMMR
jgi:hypothetical protein